MSPWLPAGQLSVDPPMVTKKLVGADQTFGTRSGCV
jgi:hypothetical protein